MSQANNPLDFSITKAEKYDVDMLEYLFKCDGVSEKDKSTLRLIKKRLVKGNILNSTYKLAKTGRKLNMGRLYTVEPSLQYLSRDIRASLTAKNYEDVDVINAQPTILSQVCKKHNWSCDKLDYYIENREKVLDDLCTQNKIPRWKAKELINSICFGGNPSNLTEFLIDMKEEITTISKTIHAVLLPKHNPKDSNKYGSAMALILQEEEKKILLAMDAELFLNDYCMGVYIHDGGLVERKENKPISTEILKKVEASVYKATGYKIKLKVKPIETTFQIEHKEDTYPILKQEFELTHFKLMNPAVYCRYTNDDLQFLKKKELTDLYLNKDGGTFIINWIQDPNIRCYEGLGFYPNPDLCPNNCFNLFKGFDVTKIEPVETNIQRILDQVKYLANNDMVCYEYILNFIADIFQNPERKSRVCLVFNGTEGTGKDSFWDFVGDMIGACYMTTGRAEEDIFGRFNYGASQRVLIKCEETKLEVLRKNKETLKTIITCTTGKYERKGRDTISLNSCERYVLTTNDDIPVIIGSSDRRFVIMTPSLEKVGNRDYFTALTEDYGNPDIQRAFYDFLMKRDLSKVNLTDRPMTEAYEQTKQASAPFHAKFFQRFIMQDSYANVMSFKCNELISKMNKYTTFETSLSSFGIAIKPYITAGAIKKTLPRGTVKYTIDKELVKAFLKQKGWWVDFESGAEDEKADELPGQ